MNEKQTQLLDECIQYIRQCIPEVVAIYLFGSFGTPLERRESDIDLAVLAKKPLDPVILWNIAQEIRIRIKKNVEIIDLVKASTIFQYQILSSERRLFCKDEWFCALWENVHISMYFSFQKEREEVVKDRMSHG